MSSQERPSVSDSFKHGSANGHPYDGKNLGKNESSPLPLDPGRTQHTFLLFFFPGTLFRTRGTNSSGRKSSMCFFHAQHPMFYRLLLYVEKKEGKRTAREKGQ
jgi:hypothetical protein